MYDLIVIGGGPAALSAATFALGKLLKLLVIADSFGGKAGWQQRIAGQVGEEYLAGAEAVQVFEQRITHADCTLHDRVRNVTKRDEGFAVETEHHGVYQATALIVATGASPIELLVPGAREFTGQGLGYSVTTHAHMLADKSVAVIGNTLRSLRGTAELARTAARVYLIVPDPSVLTSPIAVALRQRANVEILAGAHVKEIAGNQNVEEVVVACDGQERRLPVDAAFVDLGLKPNCGMVRNLLDLDPGMFINIDDRNATKVTGLFASGDVTTAFGEQTLIAIGEGARAALSAYDYILAQR